MAASTTHKLSTILILSYLFCQYTVPAPINYKYKIHIFNDSTGLLVDVSFLAKYRPISLLKNLVIARVVICRRNLQSMFNTSYVVNKATKHGLTVLILPVKPFIMDLTICVDISPNPGPKLDNSEINNLGSHSVKSSSSRMSVLESKANNLSYTSRFLRSLRFIPSCKYIDRNIYSIIGLLRIQKPFRGRRSGRRVKQREAQNRHSNVFRIPYQICMSSSRKNILLRNQCKIPVTVLISNRMNSPRPYTKPAPTNLIRIPLIDESFHNSRKHVRLCCLNARSIKNKSADFVCYGPSTGADIFAITETWLRDMAHKAEIILPGYKLLDHPRIGRIGGWNCIVI